MLLLESTKRLQNEKSKSLHTCANSIKDHGRSLDAGIDQGLTDLIMCVKLCSWMSKLQTSGVKASFAISLTVKDKSRVLWFCDFRMTELNVFSFTFEKQYCQSQDNRTLSKG